MPRGASRPLRGDVPTRLCGGGVCKSTSKSVANAAVWACKASVFSRTSVGALPFQYIRLYQVHPTLSVPIHEHIHLVSRHRCQNIETTTICCYLENPHRDRIASELPRRGLADGAVRWCMTALSPKSKNTLAVECCRVPI